MPTLPVTVKSSDKYVLPITLSELPTIVFPVLSTLKLGIFTYNSTLFEPVSESLPAAGILPPTLFGKIFNLTPIAHHQVFSLPPSK